MADTWKKLDPSLSISTLKSIADLGFKRLTPVQVNLLEVKKRFDAMVFNDLPLTLVSLGCSNSSVYVE